MWKLECSLILILYPLKTLRWIARDHHLRIRMFEPYQELFHALAQESRYPVIKKRGPITILMQRNLSISSHLIFHQWTQTYIIMNIPLSTMN